MSYDPHQYNDPYASPTAESKWGEPTMPIRHSVFGVISFFISLICGFGVFAMVVAAAALEMENPGGMDEESPLVMLLGLGFIGAIGMLMLGAGLGIAGVAQSNRKKVFAYLGLAFNFLTLFGICGLIGLGMAAGA